MCCSLVGLLIADTLRAMKITSVRFVPGLSAYYFDDQAAIAGNASSDGHFYSGSVQTPGFSSVRQSGEVVSVLLELDPGVWACGDCCAVQYSGAGGRHPLFVAETYAALLAQHVGPSLIGLDAADFLGNTAALDKMVCDAQPLHTAAHYGISQALLDAAAISRGQTKTQTICALYGLAIPHERVPLFAQSGDDRYGGVDRMLMKQVDALPHALINNVDEKLGRRGEKLLAYVQWLCERIERARGLGVIPKSYEPQLHIDVYGTAGRAFDHNPAAIADYLCELDEAAPGYALYIEGPVDMGERAAQIDVLASITQRVNERTDSLRIVADEWCNTLEDIKAFVDARCCHMVQIKTPDLGGIHHTIAAVGYAKQHQVEAYQGGSCNETDIAARCCAQLALACQPDRLLVKPGMGFDEGMQIVSNEINRTLAQIEAAS